MWDRKKEMALEAPSLADELLAVDGFWRKEDFFFFSNVSTGKLSFL